MSVKIMSEVFGVRMQANRKLLLLALADHAQDDGSRVYPSVGTLARKSSMSRRSVQRYLSEWRDKGILEVIEPATAHQPTHYRLNLIILPKPERGANLSPLLNLDAPSSDAPGVPSLVTPGVPSSDAGGAPSSDAQSIREPSENHQSEGLRAGRTRAQRATVWPAALKPDDELRQFARDGGLDPGLEWGHFRDHHQAKGSRFVDWRAAWRTWCRNAARFEEQRRGRR